MIDNKKCLRELREYCRISLNELSKHLNIPTNILLDIEESKKDIEQNHLALLCEFYKVPQECILADSLETEVENAEFLGRNKDVLSDIDRQEISRFSNYLALQSRYKDV